MGEYRLKAQQEVAEPCVSTNTRVNSKARKPSLKSRLNSIPNGVAWLADVFYVHLAYQKSFRIRP